MGAPPRSAPMRARHDAWSRRWAILLGLALVVGALAPILVRSGGSFRASEAETHLVWPWQVPRAPAEALVPAPRVGRPSRRVRAVRAVRVARGASVDARVRGGARVRGARPPGVLAGDLRREDRRAHERPRSSAPVRTASRDRRPDRRRRS